jgi:hypothetical protein
MLKTIMCQTCIAPVRVRNARIKAWTMASVCVTMSIRGGAQDGAEEHSRQRNVGRINGPAADNLITVHAGLSSPHHARFAPGLGGGTGIGGFGDGLFIGIIRIIFLTHKAP